MHVQQLFHTPLTEVDGKRYETHHRRY